MEVVISRSAVMSKVDMMIWKEAIEERIARGECSDLETANLMMFFILQRENPCYYEDDEEENEE